VGIGIEGGTTVGCRPPTPPRLGAFGGSSLVFSNRGVGVRVNRLGVFREFRCAVLVESREDLRYPCPTDVQVASKIGPVLRRAVVKETLVEASYGEAVTTRRRW
jgi:hypothetical protein